MYANFTPELGVRINPTNFRFWCQKVLPLVYDDSLSYYELLCKVVNYLNSVIADVATLGSDVDNLLTAYKQLQDFVNTYFDNLDIKQELIEILGEDAINLVARTKALEENAKKTTAWGNTLVPTVAFNVGMKFDKIGDNTLNTLSIYAPNDDTAAIYYPTNGANGSWNVKQLINILGSTCTIARGDNNALHITIPARTVLCFDVNNGTLKILNPENCRTWDGMYIPLVQRSGGKIVGGAWFDRYGDRYDIDVINNTLKEHKSGIDTNSKNIANLTTGLGNTNKAIGDLATIVNNHKKETNRIVTELNLLNPVPYNGSAIKFAGGYVLDGTKRNLLYLPIYPANAGNTGIVTLYNKEGNTFNVGDDIALSYFGDYFNSFGETDFNGEDVSCCILDLPNNSVLYYDVEDPTSFNGVFKIVGVGDFNNTLFKPLVITGEYEFVGGDWFKYYEKYAIGYNEMWIGKALGTAETAYTLATLVAPVLAPNAKLIYSDDTVAIKPNTNGEYFITRNGASVRVWDEETIERYLIGYTFTSNGLLVGRCIRDVFSQNIWVVDQFITTANTDGYTPITEYTNKSVLIEFDEAGYVIGGVWAHYLTTDNFEERFEAHETANEDKFLEIDGKLIANLAYARIPEPTIAIGATLSVSTNNVTITPNAEGIYFTTFGEGYVLNWNRTIIEKNITSLSWDGDNLVLVASSGTGLDNVICEICEYNGSIISDDYNALKDLVYRRPLLVFDGSKKLVGGCWYKYVI